MSASRVEILIWVLIYGGLLTLSWSVFVHEDAVGTVWTMRVAAAAAVAAGAVLVWVRSRMKDNKDKP